MNDVQISYGNMQIYQSNIISLNILHILQQYETGNNKNHFIINKRFLSLYSDFFVKNKQNTGQLSCKINILQVVHLTGV